MSVVMLLHTAARITRSARRACLRLAQAGRGPAQAFQTLRRIPVPA